jgi:hypothetical protein
LLLSLIAVVHRLLVLQATSLAERLHQVLITSTGGETVEIQTVFSPILAASGTQLQWVQAMLAKVVDWAASASEGRLYWDG